MSALTIHGVEVRKEDIQPGTRVKTSKDVRRGGRLIRRGACFTVASKPKFGLSGVRFGVLGSNIQFAPSEVELDS